MAGNVVTLNLKIAGADQVNSALKRVGNTLKAAFAVTVGGDLAQSLGRIADAANNNAAKLRLVTKTTQEFARAQADVLAISQLTGSAIAATTDLYSKLAQSLGRLNATQSQLATVTQAVSQSLLISGATTQGAIGALTQLGQAFSSGVLRGQEFNSVAEQAPRLLQAIADEMKVPVQALRGLAREGKITSDVLLRALTGEGAAKIAAEAANIPLTIGRAFTQLQNILERYIGEVDKATGASRTIVSVISGLANNLETIAPILAGIGFVAFTVAVGRATAGLFSYVSGLSAARATAITVTQANVVLAASQNAVAINTLRAAEISAGAAVGANAQAVATVRLAEAQIAAAIAAGQLTAAQVAALAASRGFGASLLALVGGPIGATILAIAGLGVAFVTYANQRSERTEKILTGIEAEIRALDQLIAKNKEYLASQGVASEVGLTGDKAKDTANEIARLTAEIAELNKTSYADRNSGTGFVVRKFIEIIIETPEEEIADLTAQLNEFNAKADESARINAIVAATMASASGEATSLARAVDAGALSWGNYNLYARQAAVDVKLLSKALEDEIARSSNGLAIAQGKNPAIEAIRVKVQQLRAENNSLADSYADVLAQIEANDAEAKRLTQTTRDLGSAQKDAARDAEEAANKAAAAMEKLSDIARDLSAQFKGPAAQANERLTDTLNRIQDALDAAKKGVKDATVIARAEALATQARTDAYRENQTALDEIATAQKAADDAVKNYISSAEVELRNLGLSREERSINEAGLRAEKEFRDLVTEAIKNQSGEYANLTQAQINALASSKRAAAEVAQAQNIITEEGRKAAEEYERQWQQTFDNIVDAALSGGDALKNVIRDYLQDIVKQFAKKIILDVITRYSTQGSPGKAGKDGSIASGGQPSLLTQGTTFIAGVAGVRDAYRNGGGISGGLSGAASGAAAGSVFGPVGTIVGAIVGGLAGLFGGQKPADLRLGANGVTRKPEQSFNTVFGAQQIGVRGGTDTAQFVNLVTEFDKTIAGIVGNFENGQDQLDAIKNRLRTWSVDLKGDAITAEAVLGSRFNAILSTFNQDIQNFVGTLGTTQERAQRLQDAAFIQGAAKTSILANTFNDLARILAANAVSGESVAQTYERVSASVEILRAALAISGVTVKQTGDEFIKFAADIATAAGGTQEAARLFDVYFETFYTGEERALKAVEIANKRRAETLAAVGLEATTTAEQFRETFERLLPGLTPEQIVAYLRAGEAIGIAATAQDKYNTILTDAAQTLKDISGQIDAGFTTLARSGLSDLQRELLSIDDAFKETTRAIMEQRDAAVLAGASAQTLAQYSIELGRAQELAAAQAAAAIETSLRSIENSINKGLTDFERSGFTNFERELLSINDTLSETTRALMEQRAAAEFAGASAQTLARYDTALGRAQQLAAAQAAAAIERLRKAGRSLIDQLYGKGAKKVVEDAQDGYRDIGNAAQEMYDAQLNSIKTIQDYLNGQLLGNTSTLTPVQQFDEAQRQFNAAIIAGNAQEATRLADVLLRLGRDRFASSQQNTDLVTAVRAALQGLLDSIGTPVLPVGGPTGGVGGNTQNPEDFDAAARENRLELALQLSEIVRELLLATGDSLGEIAESIGLNVSALVTDLGVNLSDLSVNTASSLATIAQSLGIELTELAENVGVDLGNLADSQSLINGALKAAIDKLPAGQRDALKELLKDVETAARTGGPTEINRAIGLLEDRVNFIGGDTAEALAPFFTGVNPGNPLNSIDTNISLGFGLSNGYLSSINNNIIAFLSGLPVGTPPPPPPPPPIIENAVLPSRAQRNFTASTSEYGAQVVEQLKRTNVRLELLESTMRSGTAQTVSATRATGEKIANAAKPVVNNPKLVMSQ